MDKSELNCKSPQCVNWDEDKGCTVDVTSSNGDQICENGEERYEYSIFAIVEDGRITGVYSDNTELYINILDLDDAKRNEDENALSDMRSYIKNLESKDD